MGNLLQNSSLDLIDKVYIVYSKPDIDILTQLVSLLSKLSIYNKVKLIIESSRRGKAAAINLALNQATKELGVKPKIVIINDDDAFFDKDSLLNILKSFKDKDVCAVCIYPKYRSKLLNILYTFKRFIHKLEAQICNPATMAGELMAFRTDYIDNLNDFSLTEDLQVNTICSAKGRKVMLASGYVEEKYPDTIKGIANRTERTIVGTFIEFKRYRELLRIYGNSARKTCVYIFLSYLIGLVSMPLSLFLGFVLFVLIFLYILYLYNILSIFIIIILLITIVYRKIRILVTELIYFYLGLVHGTINALLKIRRIKNRQLKQIEIIWTETKY